MLIDKQLMFTQKIVDNMKDRDHQVFREAIEQYAEPTRQLVRRAVAVLSLKSHVELDLTNL